MGNDWPPVVRDRAPAPQDTVRLVVNRRSDHSPSVATRAQLQLSRRWRSLCT